MDSTPPPAPGQEHTQGPDQTSPGTQTPPGTQTSPGTGHGDPRGPRVTREQVGDLGRLRRTVRDRKIAGVAAGLARHLDVDPVLVRVALVVASFFGGAGLLVYGACWVLVPEEGSADDPLGLDERNRGVALVGVGVLAVILALGDWTGAFWFPWPAMVVAALVVWLVHRSRSTSELPPPWPGVDPSRAQPPDGPGSYGPASYGPASYGPVSYGPGSYGSSTYGWVSPGGTTSGQGVNLEKGASEPSTQAGWQPSGAQPWYPGAPTWVPAPNPRKRGPILFWFTLALIALAEGVLGVIDVAGAEVVPSAYPALALGVTAAMLALGAFWGRAGGLIVVGILAAAATGIATASADWESETVTYAPTQVEAVSDRYDMGSGELVLDLSRLEDVDALDNREITLDNGAGSIDVVVPDGMDVTVDADAGLGSVEVFGERSEGVGPARSGFLDGGLDAPDLTLTIDLGVGEVVVREP